MDGELTYQGWLANYYNEHKNALPKLKPCPFCGSEDISVSAGYWDCHGACYEVTCANPQCAVHPYSDLYPTEAEAIEAWNNRTETVTVTAGITTVTDTPQITYVPERTCKNVDDEFPFFKCSECGCNAVVGYGSSGDGLPNFCPNCGARVTPKNSETTPKVVSE